MSLLFATVMPRVLEAGTVGPCNVESLFKSSVVSAPVAEFFLQKTKLPSEFWSVMLPLPEVLLVVAVVVVDAVGRGA
jgi:hypothetical protein